MTRDKDYRRMINSSKWRQLRKATLSATPFCVRCREQHRTTIATEVHHISPVESATSPQARQQLMFSPANLQALCHRCHVQAHVELASKSKRVLKQRAKATAREAAVYLFGEPTGDVF